MPSPSAMGSSRRRSASSRRDEHRPEAASRASTRILHVDHSPVVGGAERSILELARAQQALGHDVSIAIGRSGPFSDLVAAAGITAVPLGWSRRLTDASMTTTWPTVVRATPDLLAAVARLRRVIRRLRPDIVQAHTKKAQLLATLAGPGLSGVLLWHLRDDVPQRPIVRLAMRLAMRRAGHAVALSMWTVSRYRDAAMLPRSGSIGHVPSGVDPAELRGLPTPWLDGGSAAVVGFIGGISPGKGPDLLVEAAELLADRDDVEFAIIGDVWFEPAAGVYGRQLEERISRSPAAARIRRLGTRRPAEAFAEIDVLAFSSRDPEPFGRVIVEAMIARRPVVAFAHGGAREILGPDTGTLVTRLDGRGLADGIAAVLADREAAHRRADAAVIAARAYEPAEIARRMADAYRDAV